ncbi:MAG: hypothetical protein HYR72_06895 [Deltaproteobacteria bacterium]|nr:hypothetical protein [Deltaproteobacteria bacterium]MBI3387173.1 hypothetical protein [Deltaproteobacteria bacterium]
MRASLRKEIHDRISSLPAADRDDALQAVGDKDRSYWFNPEWASPSAVAAVLGSEELELAWTYVQLSAAAHGAFFGMRLFRDRPDEFSVNPRIPPGKTAYSVALLSARFIVEISARRDEYEGLGMASDCDTIRRLLNVMATSR